MDFFNYLDDEKELEKELKIFLSSNLDESVNLILEMKKQLVEEREKSNNLNIEVKELKEHLKETQKKVDYKTRQFDNFVEECLVVEKDLNKTIDNLKIGPKNEEENYEKIKDLKLEIRETKKRLTQYKNESISYNSKLKKSNEKVKKLNDTIEKMRSTIQNGKDLKSSITNLEKENKELHKMVRIVNLEGKNQLFVKQKCDYHGVEIRQNKKDQDFRKFKNEFKFDNFFN